MPGVDPVAQWLRAGRSGIESRWIRDFPPVQPGPGAHPVSCKMGTGSSPGVNCGRGVLLTTHPLLVPRSWKSRAIPLPTLWATPGTLYLYGKYLESFEMWCWRRMEEISWTDRVRKEEVLQRVEFERNILQKMKSREVKWIGHILHTNCLLKHVNERKIEGRVEVTGR